MRNLSIFILFFALPSLAAGQENLSASQPFFDQSLEKYQNWLDGCGLGAGLRARSAEVKNDTMLVVFLGFWTADADSARAIWLRLRSDFEEKMGGEALETVLFDKISWYFEVPRRQARLYLSDSRPGTNAECWEARVVPDGAGQPVFQEKTKDCGFKSQDFPVAIGPQDLGGLRVPKAEEFQKTWDKKTVFQKLKPWLVARFQKPQPDGGWSHIEFKDEWKDLKFEVTDLRKEVIDHAESSWLCEVLCNCRTCLPRERLEIVLKYQKMDDGSGGFELTATVAAMYGSGIWKPREGGWHDLDDEVAKKSLLKKYGEKLMYEMKNQLLKP